MKKVKKKEKKQVVKIGGNRKKPLAQRKTKSMKSPELRVLILEDNLADAELMERQLKKDGIGFISQTLDTRSEFLKALKAFKPDLILADFKLPKFDALHALELLKKKAPFTPFIIVTGSISEEIAIECMKQGADDYLLKDRLARLGEAVRQALTNRGLQAEKMAAEEALRASKRLYHTFIDSSSDMAFLKDDRFRHLLANRALCDFYGKPENEIIGKADFELMSKSAAAKCRRSDKQALAENRIHVSEETVGDLTFETHKFPVKLADGRIGVGGYIRDISERKLVQKKIEQAAKKWTTTFDAIRNGIALLAVDQTIRQANQAFADLVNKPFRKIIGKKCYELVHPDRQPDPHCPFAKMQKSKKRESMEFALNDRMFEILVDPITNDAGAITGAAHIITDITEHKQAEAALQASEDKFKHVFEAANVGKSITLPSGEINVNQAFCDMLGYSQGELKRKTWMELTPVDEIATIQQRLEPLLKGKKDSTRFNKRYIHKNGSHVWADISVAMRRDQAGKPIHFITTIIDISERKRAESQREAALEALQESEDRYRDLVENSQDLICTHNLEGKLLSVNEAAIRLTGYPLKDLLRMNMADLLVPRVRRFFKAYLTEIQEKGRASGIMWIRTASGETRYWEYDNTLRTKDVDIPLIRGLAHDITERKRAEAQREAALAALSKSEELYRDLVENSQELIFTHDLEGKLLSVNKMASQLTGYPLKDLLRMNITDLLTPEVRHLFNVYLTELQTSGWARGRMRIRTASGETRNWEYNNTLRTKGVTVPVVRGLAHDITERRVAESQREVALTALREMNEIFRLFLKHNPIYVFIKDENIRPVYLSDNYEKLLDRPISELLGKSMDELFPSDLSHSMIEDDKRILRDGITCEFIEELNNRIYSTIKFPIFIMGKAKYLAGYTMDITERKQAEDALRESEERFRAQYHGSPIAAFTWQKQGESFVLKEYNANAEKITNGRAKEFIGKNASDMYGKRPDIMRAFQECYKIKDVISLETLSEHFIPDKQVLSTFAFIPPDLVMVHLEDITERRRAEEQILASLWEKEVLLKEIHHRVKNNLQIISGLLTLQAAQVNDERLQRMVKESQSRIWTMALIHQTLYQSGNLAAIDMADYIRSLAGNLLSSHAQIAMPPTVSFDLLPVRLVIDKAIPLALIINELVTNAMKHAFPDGRPGEIRITLQECRGVKFYAPTEDTDTAPCRGTARRAPTKQDNAQSYELTVADDGVGLPAGFDAATQKSLGLQLVAMLAKQLGGQLAIESSGGTSVHIIFNNNEKNEKQS